MTRALFRHSQLDGLMVGAALAHAAVLITLTAAPRPLFAAVMAVGIWWSSNTVSHNHLHNPFFTSRGANRAFTLFLTLVLSIPQSHWRARHVWHHAGERGVRPALSLRGPNFSEWALVASAWAILLLWNPTFALTGALPGVAAGLTLCFLQGHFEHAGLRDLRGGVSHYGRVWNLLWFNDGHHAEHHHRPGAHWSTLPRFRGKVAAMHESRFPPLLRVLEPVARALNLLTAVTLVVLERASFAVAPLQRFLIARHVAGFAKLLAALPSAPHDVCVVGGGLFPRSVLVLRQLIPLARLTVLDASAGNLALARAWLVERGHCLEGIRFVHGRFEPNSRSSCDLLVIPLGYCGDRDQLYARPLARAAIIHDWIWRVRGNASARVSALLFKRVNLVLAP